MAVTNDSNARELTRVVAINEETRRVVAIAFEINISALNAMLVALRAGEAALGFNVVSKEMRVFAASLKGCIDVDLGCSPSTNTLPIRRLRLGIGGSQTIHAAWVRFPELTVEKSAQTYSRPDEFTYRYASGTFEAELVAEGRIMHHCVASYAYSCARGECSIWTLERRDQEGLEKHQTIEVRQSQIVQCRGKRNRYPTRGEMAIVERWAKAAGLGVGAYVRVEG